MLAHAHARRAVADARDVELDVARFQFRDVRNLLPERARLPEAAQPVGQRLPQAQLDSRQTLHATDQREVAAHAVDHAGRLDGGDHACRARHHRRERRNRGSDPRVHQHFARDVAPREVRHDRSPHRKVRILPVQLADHVAYHGDGEADRVEGGERTVGFREGRAHTRSKPDVAIVCGHRGFSCRFTFRGRQANATTASPCPRRGIAWRSAGARDRRRSPARAAASARATTRP